MKAALDAIAYMSADVIDAMEKDLKASHDRILVDGGVSHNDYLMRTLADAIHRSVHRPALVETTALGAAFMAGMGCGLYKDIADIKNGPQRPKSSPPPVPTSPRSAPAGKSRGCHHGQSHGLTESLKALNFFFVIFGIPGVSKIMGRSLIGSA